MNINDIIKLGHDLDKSRNASFDLWSWLPSCEVARKHHGDYYSEFTPSMEDVMAEASLYICRMRKHPKEPYNEVEKSYFTECPCGEDHGETK